MRTWKVNVPQCSFEFDFYRLSEYFEAMKKTYCVILCSFLFLLFFYGNSFSQDEEFPRAPQPEQFHGNSEVHSIVENVERGIASSNARLFTVYFAPQVYLRFTGIEEGYYSKNQASSIVQNFFNTYRVVNFKFSTEGGTTTYYATGGGTFSSRGQRESFQVYVSIAKIEHRWMIVQFNVY